MTLNTLRQYLIDPRIKASYKQDSKPNAFYTEGSFFCKIYTQLMVKIKKLWEKIQNNPKSVKFEELKKFLQYHKFHMNRQKGSHCIFKKDANNPLIVIPKKNPVNEFYVKEVINYFKSIM